MKSLIRSRRLVFVEQTALTVRTHSSPIPETVLLPSLANRFNVGYRDIRCWSGENHQPAFSISKLFNDFLDLILDRIWRADRHHLLVNIHQSTKLAFIRLLYSIYSVCSHLGIMYRNSTFYKIIDRLQDFAV